MRSLRIDNRVIDVSLLTLLKDSILNILNAS